MPGVLQVHIGDQHADAIDKDQDWLDGSVMTAWDEYRSLLAACEILMASLQRPERGAAYFKRFTSNITESQFDQLRSNWFDIRRKGNNTITPTLVQIEEWYTEATTLTSGNVFGVGVTAVDRITRVKYETYNPSQWGRENDKSKFLYITLDRDLTREEVNTWGGKHIVEQPEVIEDLEADPSIIGEPFEPEHNPKWVHYPDDLVTPGHINQKRRSSDAPGLGTKEDVRDPGRIIGVAPGRPDTIIRTRVRTGNGSVILPSRIDELPVRKRRQ